MASFGALWVPVGVPLDPPLKMNIAEQLEAGHSIECITHAGHSIAFNMFLHYVACDL